MGRIIVLDENTSNKIAAGEVVEKPASVVKELVENSIDAGATSISVDIKNGGISYIRVSDNGCGMDEDDVEIAFERHATSKIRRAEDLDAVTTMGFRGEALASIASVSSIELKTRTAANTYGMYVHFKGGVLQEIRSTGCPVGTTFIVRDLFFNTPARYKFLKKDSTEMGYITDAITRIALGNPGISFKLTNGKTQLIHTPGNNDLKSTIFSIYGREIVKELLEVDYQDEKVKITGFIGKPESARSNRNYQSLFVNKRYVKSRLVSYAVEQGYESILMKNKFPFYVLNIEINSFLVDANVHPAKIEVRFADEGHLSKALYSAVSKALSSGALFSPVTLPSKDRELFKFSSEEPKLEYVQDLLKFQENGLVKENSLIKENSLVEESSLLKESSNTVAGFIETEIVKPVAPEQKPWQINTNVIDIIDTIDHIVDKAPRMVIQDTVLETRNKQADIKKNAIEDVQEAQEAIREEIRDEIKGDFEALADMRYIGQAFSTYILLQNSDELVLIDQHAAHERIIYEKLKQKFEARENSTQLLLEPVVVQLQAVEINTIRAHEEMLNKIGFVFDDFGNNSIIIRGIPSLTKGFSPKELFLEMTDKISNSVKPISTPLADEIIHTIACKAAIKANKRLDEKEVRQLLEQLSNTGRKYTCPHGRPTVIRLTKYEIEKMFKRIV